MTAIQIPCCLCGTMILPNSANQCGACLAQQFDLKSIIQKGPSGGDLCIFQCRQCRRYESSENSKRFNFYEPESPDLLALCMKRIPALQSSNIQSNKINNTALSGLKVLDAMWVWTEPHSMRLILRLTIRAEVGVSPRSVVIQQRIPVKFIVKFKQCPDCNREYTNRTWHAVLQLRQKHSTRKGLILLETAIAKNSEIRKHVIRMETTRNGFDFYFMELSHAQQFSSFLSKIAPMRIKTSNKLVSEDVKNNTANIKHTVVCDMVPLCRDDLIICDKRAKSVSGRVSGRMCLVSKMSGLVHFLDAAPSRAASIEDCMADVHPEKFWKEEKHFRLLFSSKRMTRFVVLDVELCSSSQTHRDQTNTLVYKGPNSGVEKYALADVEVARESDFGHSDETFSCTTHLGHILQVGDIVLGYDLVSSVLPSDVEWSVEKALNSSFVMPDVVLVKKIKGDSTNNQIPNHTNEDENSHLENGKKKFKSSASKRRERRQRKQEEKMKKLEDAAARMGFTSATNDNYNEEEEDAFDEERKAFEEELKNDPELANELNMAEHELAKGHQPVSKDTED